MIQDLKQINEKLTRKLNKEIHPSKLKMHEIMGTSPFKKSLTSKHNFLLGSLASKLTGDETLKHQAEKKLKRGLGQHEYSEEWVSMLGQTTTKGLLEHPSHGLSYQEFLQIWFCESYLANLPYMAVDLVNYLTGV